MSIKPYILGQVVARGGMAEVYRGLHVGQDGFRRLVAIKRILPHHSQNQEFTEMFKDEAHIGQRLQHANIVKVEGFDIIDGSASIIMEFVDGSDVRALLSGIENKKQTAGKREFLPNALCAYVVAEAARGLHYAHTRKDDITGRALNIVHRDISPQNILISWEGEVKVTDFGIAAAERDFKQTETKAGIVKGKYSYMSPEQISGKKCDAKTDIFALSVVLWEMLAMRRLFTADNEIEVIEMVRQCKLPGRLKDFNKNVTDDLDAIVLRGLTKDPRRRYESMESFEKTLRVYLAKEFPNTSAADLSLFMKEFLSDKRETAQEEMRKILTSTQLPIAAAASSASRSVEINLDDTSQGKTSFTVGKVQPAGLNQQAKSQRHTAQPQKHSQGTNQDAHQFLRSASARKRQTHGQTPANLTPFYVAMALIIAVIAGGAALKQHRSAAKQALMLNLRTVPATVKIKINDRDYAGGRFLTSPHKIKLDPGLNSIEITRPGYYFPDQKLFIKTDDGMPKKPPTVRLLPKATFAPVRLEYRGKETITAVINDGFFRTNLSPSQNIEQVPDISGGTPSRLIVLNQERKVLVNCQFTPMATTTVKPLIVKFSDSGACEILGPAKEGKP
jgi:serine/threonine-protein kinase